MKPFYLAWNTRRAIGVFLALFIAVLLGTTAEAEEPKTLKGVALVIGQSKYTHITPLPNPANDARDMSKLLTDLGFDGRAVTDRDASKLSRDLERFVEDAEGADIAFLYYSGHGIEAGGENYLVPVNADDASLGNASEELVSLSQVVDKLKATVPVVIVLVDACRTNPFPANAQLKATPDSPAQPVTVSGLGAPRGAAVVEQVPAATDNLGTVIGFAAEPGRPALDGAVGGNSPYAAALLRHLSAMKGAELGSVMRMVTEEVYLSTDTRQRPWVNESLRRMLYLGVAPDEPEGEDGLINGERRQLLLTIADLPTLERQQVESIAKEDGVPLSALYGVLRALGAKDMPKDPAALDKILKKQAETLKKMMAERKALDIDDPEIKKLADSADRALQQGAIGVARQFLDDAVKRIEEMALAVDAAEQAVKMAQGSIEKAKEDIAKAQEAVKQAEEDFKKAEQDLKKKRLADAAIYARRAEASSLAFDYEAAAKDYAKAWALAQKYDDKLKWNYKNLEAEALNSYGYQKGENAALLKSIAVYEEILTFIPAGEKNADWAITRNNMGVAYLNLAERAGDNKQLEQAAQIFRDSLTVLTRQSDPVNWAATQNNLGNALLNLGKRQIDSKQLEEAVAAYRAVLEVRSREKTPVDWSDSQNNLGIALYTLGEREGSDTRLVEAAAAYRAGLSAISRDAEPNRWGVLQNNLGNTLNVLGARKNDLPILKEAVNTFRAALEIRTRDKVPLQWGSTMTNLGGALTQIGMRVTGTTELEDAVKIYREAMQEITRGRSPVDWAATQNNLASALQHLGQRNMDGKRLEEAAAIYRDMFGVYSREHAPLDWATTQLNLGNVLQTLGKLNNDPAKLDESVAAYRLALSELTVERTPMQWATAQSMMGTALESIGFGGGGVEKLKESIAAKRAALTILTKDNGPLEWAQAQFNIGNSLNMIANFEKGTESYETALVAFNAALEVYTLEETPMQWAMVQNGIGDVYWGFGTRRTDKKAFETSLAQFEKAKIGYGKGGLMAWGMVNIVNKKIEIIKEALASKP